jgi:nucleoside-diphosphate-sugar epimerase
VTFLVVGASGVLGRALLPHLAGHRIVGTTRSPDKLELVSALGAEAVLVDVYESGALERLAVATAPDVVVNLLTDLASGAGPANDRIRSEGGPIVTAAARASRARRLIVESVAFSLPAPGSTNAVRALETDALTSGVDALVLRFGLFWGPGTWNAAPPKPPRIHIDEAGRWAAELILSGASGVHTVAEATSVS